ncbi:MAG: hypothetical protein ACE5OY_04815 [Candidatus Bathyarchaeia archaeon]
MSSGGGASSAVSTAIGLLCLTRPIPALLPVGDAVIGNEALPPPQTPFHGDFLRPRKNDTEGECPIGRSPRTPNNNGILATIQR